MRHIELTLQTARVVRAFLDDPARARYGFELMRMTGLPSGTLYPMLARLERAGWVTSATEDVDPRAAGRPRRRCYTLTSAAASEARAQLAAIAEQFSLPSGGHEDS